MLLKAPFWQGLEGAQRKLSDYLDPYRKNSKDADSLAKGDCPQGHTCNIELNIGSQLSTSVLEEILIEPTSQSIPSTHPQPSGEARRLVVGLWKRGRPSPSGVEAKVWKLLWKLSDISPTARDPWPKLWIFRDMNGPHIRIPLGNEGGFPRRASPAACDPRWCWLLAAAASPLSLAYHPEVQDAIFALV